MGWDSEGRRGMPEAHKLEGQRTGTQPCAPCSWAMSLLGPLLQHPPCLSPGCLCEPHLRAVAVVLPAGCDPLSLSLPDTGLGGLDSCGGCPRNPIRFPGTPSLRQANGAMASVAFEGSTDPVSPPAYLASLSSGLGRAVVTSQGLLAHGEVSMEGWPCSGRQSETGQGWSLPSAQGGAWLCTDHVFTPHPSLAPSQMGHSLVSQRARHTSLGKLLICELGVGPWGPILQVGVHVGGRDEGSGTRNGGEVSRERQSGFPRGATVQCSPAPASGLSAGVGGSRTNSRCPEPPHPPALPVKPTSLGLGPGQGYFLDERDRGQMLPQARWGDWPLDGLRPSKDFRTLVRQGGGGEAPREAMGPKPSESLC